MSRYERRLRNAARWSEIKLWLQIAAIILIPFSLVLWALLEYRHEF